MNIDSEDDSDGEYEMCTLNTNSFQLPFDPANIEKVILAIIERFNFRVIMNDNRAKGALLVTTGLTIAGGLLGRHYGGKVGAAVGGAVGGACGIGIVIVSMRSIWNDIKGKLSEVFDIVYDYLAGLGLDDYKRVATFLARNDCNIQLAMMILETASAILGKKIISSLTVG